MAPTSVLDAVTTEPQGRWVGRPRLARFVRASVVVLPVLVATFVGWLVAQLLPVATTDGQVWLYRFVILAVAGAVAWATGPLAKRLLPLGAMLELTLVFPDQAPPRMATALRSTSSDELAELVARTKRDGLPEDSAEAARVVLALTAALSRHDHITRGHSERVRAYAALIAKEMGLPQERIDRIGWAGLLHDIGKLTIDGEILNKPSRLTDREYEIIKGHAAAGQHMVEPLRDWLGDATDAVGQHHERWDGTGYPNGLRGDEISLEARIMSVADVFDVITAQRSYKSPSSPADARQEIARCAGTQFDPEVVRAFLAISMSDFRLTRGPVAVLAQLPVVAGVTATGALPAVGSVVTASVVLGASSTLPEMGVHEFLAQADLAGAVVASASEEPSEDAATEAGASEGDDRVTSPGRSGTRSAPAAAPAATPPDPGATAPREPASPEQDATGDTRPTGTAGGAGSNAASSNPGSEGGSPGAGSDSSAFEDAVAAARAAAAADHAAVDAALAAELADIDAKDAEKQQTIRDRYDEDTTEAREDRDEAEADLVEKRAKRDEKIAEIDRKLAEELAKLRAERDEELAEIEEERQEGEISDAEAAQAREEVRAEYRADVEKEETKAQEDRDDENRKVAEAEQKASEKYEEATREAREKRDADLAKNAADRDDERADEREHAAKDHAKIDEDLEKELRELEEEHDMPPGSA